MLPNTKKRTVLPVFSGFQGVAGKPESGNGESACQPFGAFKKMTARSGCDDQIRVFLHPRYADKCNSTKILYSTKQNLLL